MSTDPVNGASGRPQNTALTVLFNEEIHLANNTAVFTIVNPSNALLSAGVVLTGSSSGATATVVTMTNSSQAVVVRPRNGVFSMGEALTGTSNPCSVTTYGCANGLCANAGGAGCVFPFTYNSQQYTQCTTVDHAGKHWCYTTNTGKWGECSAACVAQPTQNASLTFVSTTPTRYAANVRVAEHWLNQTFIRYIVDAAIVSEDRRLTVVGGFAQSLRSYKVLLPAGLLTDGFMIPNPTPAMDFSFTTGETPLSAG